MDPTESGEIRMGMGTMRRTVVCGAALGLVAAVLAPAAATATGTRAEAGGAGAGAPATVLFGDSYEQGFSTGEDGRWMVIGDEDWPAGDGVPTTEGGTLRVAPAAVHPGTGEPAFGRTTGQQAEGGGGALDHIKWIAFPQVFTADGTPGFEVPATGSISCEHRLSARTYGTQDHPFGAAVSDPDSDPRLASVGMVTADFATQAIADFSVTNSAIYAIYERLPAEGATYAAYAYAIPVATRAPGDVHDLEIRIDQGGKRVTWLVDGRQKLQTDRIGTRAFDRRHMTIDHGGTEERLALRQVTCGFALGTLLDGARPGARQGQGLVRLDSTPGFYFDPRSGQPVPQTFLDEASGADSRLWGQGAELRVEWTRVVRRG
ncbi:hypothetical protein SUDANB171_01638 [Streptomyces sp. enrichment culture]|uniref:DUF6081 family protein n=1 Tax=Streptomyces sp. enrichment culture TaxID=1795815 RepID=UPI003F5579C0